MIDEDKLATRSPERPDAGGPRAADAPATLDAARMEAVANLAGVIAHDFNNLLTIVTGHAEILLDALTQSSGVRRSALEIKNAADAAARISDQLLAISRKQAVTPHPTDINELLRRVTETLQQIVGNGVDLWFDLDPNLPLVDVDERQMERVLRGLVASLRDGMRSRGRVRITTRSTDTGGRRDAQIVLADTRGAITVQQSHHVFEPVLDATRMGRGAGLAMAVAYGIVAQCGGELRCEPCADGMKIVIALPVPPDPQTRLRW